MNQQCMTQIAGGWPTVSRLTCGKRASQQPGRSAPTARAAGKLRFVYLGDLVKLAVEQRAFRYSFARRVETISGQRCRQMMTFVAGK